ncbi:MAG: hypothetical protein LBS62_05465 [Clostridiales bacterium]|nr:hypothetical protein [Clostridiales bacterium]
MLPFIKRGSHYVFLPKILIERELAEGELLEIPLLDGEIPPLQNYIIYPHAHPSASVITKWMSTFNV